MTNWPDQLAINETWSNGTSGRVWTVTNPATGVKL